MADQLALPSDGHTVPEAIDPSGLFDWDFIAADARQEDASLLQSVRRVARAAEQTVLGLASVEQFSYRYGDTYAHKINGLAACKVFNELKAGEPLLGLTVALTLLERELYGLHAGQRKRAGQGPSLILRDLLASEEIKQALPHPELPEWLTELLSPRGVRHLDTARTLLDSRSSSMHSHRTQRRARAHLSLFQQHAQPQSSTQCSLFESYFPGTSTGTEQTDKQQCLVDNQHAPVTRQQSSSYNSLQR